MHAAHVKSRTDTPNDIEHAERLEYGRIGWRAGGKRRHDRHPEFGAAWKVDSGWHHADDLDRLPIQHHARADGLRI